MEEVLEYLKQFLKKEDSIVVGVSGGPDSMALLYVLIKLQKQIPFKLICAHVNHNMRVESESEKEFVKEFCKQNQVTFEYKKIEHYGDDNFHNEARTIRYEFFESLIQKYNAQYLMTAHHGDDLMETVLMRITRGSTLKGYSGFSRKTVRKNYTLIRPFIKLTKEDLLTFLDENHISYVTDQSNIKDVYTRNRYRKYILPALKDEYPKVQEKFYKFSKTLMDFEKYIEKEVSNKLPTMYQNGRLDLKLLKTEEELIQKNILCKLLEEYYQEDLMLLTDSHVELILNLIHHGASNGFICLPNEVRVYKNYDYLTIEAKKEISGQSYEIEFTGTAILPNGWTIEEVKESSSDSNYICRLSKEEVTFPLIIRTKEIGDKMEVKGMHGSKKIKDIFIDSKILLEERKSYPIVTDSENKIVWLPGLKKSKFDKTKEEKYDIILKYDSGRRNL